MSHTIRKRRPQPASLFSLFISAIVLDGLGRPQFGQASASIETVCPQSKHFAVGIIAPYVAAKVTPLRCYAGVSKWSISFTGLI
jgi:hypothetical protein